MILRRKNSFSKLHGFKETCKINSALCRLLRVNINELLDNFLGALPEFVTENFPVEVPTRNNLDYVIIRTVSYYKILKRISSCCLKAGEYYIHLLTKGFFFEILTLLLAVISKIYKLVNVIGNSTIDLYNILLKYRKKFPEGKVNLYENLELPTTLQRFKFELKTPENLEASNNKSTMKLVETAVLKPQIPKPTNEIGRKVEDFGLVAEFDINNFKTSHDISTFFKEENIRRKEKNGTSLTEKISFGDWKMISSVVSKKIMANDDKNAISTFKRLMTKYLK